MATTDAQLVERSPRLCPHCQSVAGKAVEIRFEHNHIRRAMVCGECGGRWTQREFS